MGGRIFTILWFCLVLLNRCSVLENPPQGWYSAFHARQDGSDEIRASSSDATARDTRRQHAGSGAGRLALYRGKGAEKGLRVHSDCLP